MRNGKLTEEDKERFEVFISDMDEDEICDAHRQLKKQRKKCGGILDRDDFWSLNWMIQIRAYELMARLPLGKRRSLGDLAEEDDTWEEEDDEDDGWFILLCRNSRWFQKHIYPQEHP